MFTKLKGEIIDVIIFKESIIEGVPIMLVHLDTYPEYSTYFKKLL